MAIRIAGVNVPLEKKAAVALTYIYGIGDTRSLKILADAKVDPETRMKDLKETEVNVLRDIIEKKFVVEGDLRRETSSNIKRLREINCYRGSRHTKHLPVRGQRTKTNSRTVRGNKRMTAVSGKAKAGLKT
jgi:small subunit ribosomal protein S13